MAASTSFSLPPISELFKDPFSTLGEDDGPVEKVEGTKCEISFCDSRYNAKGDRIYLHTGTKRWFDTPITSYDSAILVTKYYDKQGNVQYTETDINSPHIKEALREVVSPSYGLNLDADRVAARNFTHCLFFHHEQLRDYGQSLKDEEAARHVNLVLEHLYQNHGRAMRSFKENVEKNTESDEAEPTLAYDDLWMAFRPGDLVTRKVREIDTICRLVRTSYERWFFSTERELKITLQFLECNGEFFGYRQTDKRHSFGKTLDGYERLRDMKIRPLRYLRESERDSIIRAATIRGQKFIRLAAGVHHCEYRGLAKIIADEMNDWDEYTKLKATVKSRVMLDSLRFAEMRNERSPSLLPSQPKYEVWKDVDKTIPDGEKLLAHHSLRGFSFTLKKWGVFRIENTDEVKYDENAFERLILPEIQKNMVRALVSTHDRGKMMFDDIIAGKGQGMTILLHGAPGLGKTLTAESVAEHLKRPLYALTAADFSEKLAVTEKRLSDVFDLTAHWGAVLLIDEADVFLAQRTFADVERNAIVAVFLRALEYYNGVLILTTNRVTTLDAAFRSRIHLGIKYQPLSAAARREIWRTFIEKSEDCDKTSCLDEEFLDTLLEHQIDGRKIRNAVRMAHALATDANTSMSQSHLQMALKTMDMFEYDMTEEQDNDRDERGSDMRHSQNPRKRKRKSRSSE